MEWLARVGNRWRLGIRFELQVGFPYGASLVFPVAYTDWIRWVPFSDDGRGRCLDSF